MEHGDSMAGNSASGHAQTLRTVVDREIRGVHYRAEANRDAGSASRDPALAVRRGTPPGRSDASADHHGDRTLWQVAAEPEWRADPSHYALEIRIQGNQIDRADSIHRERTANDVEHLGAKRIRVLRQRESQ